jgi:hypothetical protein
MAKVRDILIHVSVARAVRSRKCHRKAQHRVQAGELFLLIRDAATLGSKNYCKECAREMLSHARSKLEEISQQLA